MHKCNLRIPILSAWNWATSTLWFHFFVSHLSKPTQHRIRKSIIRGNAHISCCMFILWLSRLNGGTWRREKSIFKNFVVGILYVYPLKPQRFNLLSMRNWLEYEQKGCFFCNKNTKEPVSGWAANWATLSITSFKFSVGKKEHFDMISVFLQFF